MSSQSCDLRRDWVSAGVIIIRITICIAPFIQKNAAQSALQQKQLHAPSAAHQKRHKMNINHSYSASNSSQPGMCFCEEYCLVDDKLVTLMYLIVTDYLSHLAFESQFWNQLSKLIHLCLGINFIITFKQWTSNFEERFFNFLFLLTLLLWFLRRPPGGQGEIFFAFPCSVFCVLSQYFCVTAQYFSSSIPSEPYVYYFHSQRPGVDGLTEFYFELGNDMLI